MDALGRERKPGVDLWIAVPIAIAIVLGVALFGLVTIALAPPPADYQSLPGDMESALKTAHGGPAAPVQSTGPAGVLAQLTQQSAKVRADDIAAMEAQITRAGCMKVLERGSLGRTANFAAKRAAVGQCLTIVSRYRASASQRLGGARARIEAADLPPSLKAASLRGFDGSVADARRDSDQSFDLLTDILTQIDQVLAMLDTSRAGWTQRGGDILFSDRRLMEAYNGHMRRIEQDDTQAVALSQRADQKLQGHIDRLRNGLKP